MPHAHPDKALKAARASNWIIGISAALIALAALVVGTSYGGLASKQLKPQLIAWLSAAVFLFAGVVATSRVSSALSHFTTRRTGPSARGIVKMLSALAGYLLVILGLLALLGGLEKLLVGAGLAGVVLGIAAQQSLGNVFAGFVLLVARPFAIGNHIRIRAGALGGIFDAWVVETSLTYVTLRTDDGLLKVPNSAMLAAGVLMLPAVDESQVAAAVALPSPAPVPAQASPPGPGATTGAATTGAAGVVATGQPGSVPAAGPQG
ncbi:MAG TPA: mechanosensitive ion channel domain-containing protein [Acidimicrobiales bacterium]|nr:mechanosensitive ion channel domain-containing protein [Acidimicrobiales bacterium]